MNRGVPGSIGDELDEVAACAGPVGHRDDERGAPPCPSPGEQSVASTAVTWPRTGCSSAVPGGRGRPPGRAEDDEADQGGERHRARAARRAAPGLDGLPARPARCPCPCPCPCPCVDPDPDPAGRLGLAVR